MIDHLPGFIETPLKGDSALGLGGQRFAPLDNQKEVAVEDATLCSLNFDRTETE